MIFFSSKDENKTSTQIIQIKILEKEFLIKNVNSCKKCYKNSIIIIIPLISL